MQMSRFLLPVPAALALALAACGGNTTDSTTDNAAAEADRAAESTTTPGAVPPPVNTSNAVAMVTLAPTAGNETAGTLRFAAVDGRIEVTGEVTGLSDGGTHAFHVHENGDCSAPDASSAGGHFNPGDNAHGRVGHGEHHAGDSDNITANADGTAQVQGWLEGATIGDGAATDIVGKGVIVHTGEDDYTSQPTGDAGDRLACGVIEAG